MALQLFLRRLTLEFRVGCYSRYMQLYILVIVSDNLTKILYLLILASNKVTKNIANRKSNLLNP